MLRRPAVNGIAIVSPSQPVRSTNGIKPRPNGKGRLSDLASTSEAIAGEYVLDPSLPFALPDHAVNLSRLTSGNDSVQGNKRKRGSIDGEPPSAVFKTELGDVDLRLSVVNEETMRGDDMGMPGGSSTRSKSKKARVEISSVRGHIRVDLVSRLC
jgi:hypothetical protein